MDFNFSDEQQGLSESLSRLLDDHYSFEQRRAIAANERGASEKVWGHLAQMGVTALGIPETYGGLGGGNLERLPVMQALGRHLATEPYLTSLVLAATAVREAGNPHQTDTQLTRVANGSLVMAWAHDETAARHAPLWVETRARREGEGWRLDGVKNLVLHAGLAQHFIVTARLEGQPDAEQGLAIFVVDAQAPGCTVRSYRLMDDTPAGELSLRGAAAVPLGDANNSERALAAMRTVLASGTAAVCADMVGAMESAFLLTTQYVNTRKQFGKLIGEYQALRHRVAEMAVSLEVARSMAMAAAIAADNPAEPDSSTDLPRAKLLIGRQARALAHAAIQSHGGIGMTEEYAVGHCLRRIHVLDQLFGDVDEQAARLASMGA